MFDSPKDFNFDPQVINREGLLEETGHPNSILFRCEDAGDAASFAAFEKALHLPFGITVMVGKTLGQFQFHAETQESSLEALRRGDGREGACAQSLEFVQRENGPRGEILEFHRTVSAL